ncbi:hypothetical protein K469DRAFT_555258 [Zopfia rhizophila CBS 207.26]|uniref:PNPLA domain-containing protein n=1 Tax=Zopfia rhizophila CBS 207.26 TaxID=1314779 RepID=A0A6A6EJG0_9PEZI|nr:hypothetical protein K469DRAFT_555258 [Zopfia rhizophila CBS 207.26]
MPKHDLRMLALNGGGVRGLSTLQILQRLMDTVDPESPPKPYDYFDIIKGTNPSRSAGYRAEKKRKLVAIFLNQYKR